MVTCLILSADGTEIFSGSYDGTVRRWLVQTGQFLQVYQDRKGHENGVTLFAVLPNGNIFSGAFYSIKIWDRLTGACLQTLEGHTNWVIGLMLCTNGDLVSASSDCSLRVWRAGNTVNDPYVCRQVVANAHSTWVRCVTTVPGTDDVISGGHDHAVKLWHRANPTADYICVRTFEGHTDSVTSVAVMDNRYVVSGSFDEMVKIWSLNTVECLHTLSGHTDWVQGVAVLPGNEIVSASEDKTLKIWF